MIAEPLTLDKELQIQLRDYQKVGRDFLIEKRRAFLTDDAGLGKTLQAAEAAVEFPALVSAPAYLTDQWYNFLKNQYPDKKVVIATGATMHRFERQQKLKKKADWYVVNHQMFRGWFEFPDCRTVIFDECHHLRNRTALQSRGAAKYASDMDRYVYMLSASPMWKDTDDIWMQLHILQPQIFTSYRDFVDYFMLVDDTAYGPKVLGLKRQTKRELESMLSVLMLGRSYKDVGRQLPPTIETEIAVEFPKPIRDKYEELRRKYRIQLEEDETLILSNYLQVMRLLRLFTNFKDKQEAAINRIEDVDKPTLVYTWYKDTASDISKLMQQRFGKDNVYCLTGDIPPQERHRLAHEAQRKGKHIVATLSALGEGINLYHYRHVLFYEEDWPPGRNYQALRRVLRDRNDDGQDIEPVLVSYVHIARSIDTAIHKISQKRSSNIKQVMQEILL